MKALLTAEELAEELRVRPSWVVEKGAKGEIPSVKVGMYRRYVLADVLRALKDDAAGEAA